MPTNSPENLPTDMLSTVDDAPAAVPLSPEEAAEVLVHQVYQEFLRQVDYLPAADMQRVEEAFVFACNAHEGQRRNSGEPYITHPIAVAAQCAQWRLDAPALMAALMHDAMEDCGITKQDIVQRFGADVAELVDGLTKLEKLQFLTREENQAESFRKMLLAMAKDVRVILIKLADRTHNMRTLDASPRSKWGRISRETLDIYVPIADRLGLNATYRELQELSFRHLFPWRYTTLEKAVAKAKTRRRGLADKIAHEVEQAFNSAHMPVRLLERELSLYKIYQQMQTKRLSFARVNDIFGLRIIFDKVADCYTGIGVLHQLYKPVPGSFKDYIASAKSNGYQSLHTTLLGPSGVDVEAELRTEVMNMVAESGIAAHWLYQAKNLDTLVSNGLNGRWLKSLLEIENETQDSAEFLDNVKVDLFPDSIYVFTPKNHILTLPVGATVVDFAYAIHSNVGDHIASALVNGEASSLRAVLKNNDMVEILTSPEAKPSLAWLEFVKTGRARSKIRSYFKQADSSESRDLGERLLAQALRAAGYGGLPTDPAVLEGIWQDLSGLYQSKTADQLLSDIGMGKLIAREVVEQIANILAQMVFKPDALLLTRERLTSLQPTHGTSVLAVGGRDSAPVRYASCCRPVPGDVVTGVLLRGKGLEIHREHCPLADRLFHKDPASHVEVEWADDTAGDFQADLRVYLRNSKGALADASAVIAQSEVNILRINMFEEEGRETVEVRCLVSVNDAAHIDALLRNLRKSRVVLRAEREWGQQDF
ncbi:GTP pyrophosphokinase [Lampropedia hyalina DSM 16112]|jgi:GTP pyrophosphokinase|uniref:GTP pyrophosphokinase n=2 Tax=Lampropedia TaxID=198705 RepID=A0A1M4SK35_9BURK|nr:GTP pyrophosphokinase [Lampropedia hyalina DSM 16112]